MRPLVENICDSYFSLAGTGSLLYWCRSDDWAESCLERSLALRPGNYLHLYFVGYVQMMAGKWLKARENLSYAATLQPNVIDFGDWQNTAGFPNL